jgi:hypothetical protein
MWFPILTWKQGRCWADVGRGDAGQVEDRTQGHFLGSSYFSFIRHPEDTVLTHSCWDHESSQSRSRGCSGHGGSDCGWEWSPQDSSVRETHPRCGYCWHGPAWAHMVASILSTPETEEGPCICPVEWLGIPTQLFYVQFNVFPFCIFCLYLFYFSETFRILFSCGNLKQDICIYIL